jgi:hypothetical protein
LSPFLCPFYWRDDNDGDGDGDDDEGDDEGDGDGILLDAQKIVNWLGGQTRTHRSSVDRHHDSLNLIGEIRTQKK